MDYTSKWQIVQNNVNDRLVDNSLLHSLSVEKKIKRQTRIFNAKLKKIRIPRSYKHYVSLRRQVLNECPDSEAETDDEPQMDYESYKQFYKDKSHPESGRLRTFLQLCVRTKGRSRYKEKPERKQSIKKPTVVCKKPARVPNVKNSKRSQPKKDTKVKVQTDLTQYWLRSSKKPSELSSKKQNSIETVKKLQPLKTRPSEPKKVPSISRDENNDEDSDREEEDSKEKQINDSEINNIKNGSLDISESMSGERSAIDNDCLAVYHAEETPLIELQSIKMTESEDPVESDKELQIPISLKQDLQNIDVNATDDSNAFDRASSSREIFITPNLHPKDNLQITEEKVEPQVEFHLPTETDMYYLTSDYDSGNNSLSDTNSLVEQPKRKQDISTDNDNWNEKTVVKGDLNVTEKNIISLNELKFEDEETVSKPRGIVETGILAVDENLLEKEIQTAGDDDIVKEKNSELKTTQELDLQSEQESVVENKANKGSNKRKIQKVERYKERYEFSNKEQLLKMKNVELLNDSVYEVTDSLDKLIENIPPLYQSDGDDLEYRKSSVNSPYSLDQSNHLDDEDSSLIVHSNGENVGEFNIEKSLLAADDEQSKCNSFSREHNFPTIPSPTSDHSSINSFSSFRTKSYDEEFENCGKMQLLSASEPIIESNEKQNEQIDVRPIAESIQLSASVGFTEKSNRTEFRSHPNKYSDITGSLPSPKHTSNKRPICSIDTDSHIFEMSAPSSEKQPRLEQMSDRQLKVRSCKYAAPKARLGELQPAENKDDSSNRINQNLSTTKTAKPKRRRRPRTLEEFATAEDLCLDMTEPCFRLKNIGEDDEIWLMDIPKMIDPRDLKDQTILLGGKRQIILEDNCYKVSSKRSEETSTISCIFTTSRRKKEYDIVNVEAQGRIKFTPKHSVIPETRIVSAKLENVPFPKNLRRRHPLLGTVNENYTERE